LGEGSSEETERAGLPILHFEDGRALEAWLEQQPEGHKGIWLKLAKKGQGVSSVGIKQRRMQIDAAIQGSSRGEIVVRDLVKSLFVEWKDASIRNLAKPRTNAEVLLCNLKHLAQSIESIATFESSSLNRNVQKQISRIKGGAGLQVGNLQFRGVTNDLSHPVRRISDNATCDLKAFFRLGHVVPARFEFDVTSVGSWNSRRFANCDGTETTVPASATHVNMRINGDHAW
jgi:hypothetical protein